MRHGAPSGCGGNLILTVHRPVVERSRERWHEAGARPPLDYVPGEPLGESRHHEGRWRGPSLARLFGIATDYPDRASLIDALRVAARRRRIPILILVSGA